ncbi:hypothetical protein LXL04_004295 [Taraxacum kok-saghyz]
MKKSELHIGTGNSLAILSDSNVDSFLTFLLPEISISRSLLLFRFTFYSLKASRKLKNNSKLKSIKARNQNLEFIFFACFRSSKSELHILGYSYIRFFNSEGSGGIISASNLNSELTSEQEPTSESKLDWIRE